MDDDGSLADLYSPEIVVGSCGAGVLFVCDHASNAVPIEYGSLGLLEAELGRHIAYDIGAAHATRRLAELFDAPAVLTRVSRLMIDVNRGVQDPTLVMRVSDGAIVPGNAYADHNEIDRRIARFWTPYRKTIASLLDELTERGPIPALISVHSFTPVWRGQRRPWQVGVLWDSDPRLATPLIHRLRADGLVVGDNEPYDGALPGDTMNALGIRRGLAHFLLELRQDLVGDRSSAEAWADRLAPSLRIVLADPEAHMIRRFTSRTEARRPSAGSNRFLNG